MAWPLPGSPLNSRVKNIYCGEVSNIVGCDAALLGKWQESFTDHLILQDEGNVFLQNAGNHLTSDSALHHRRLESSITSPWKFQTRNTYSAESTFCTFYHNFLQFYIKIHQLLLQYNIAVYFRHCTVCKCCDLYNNVFEMQKMPGGACTVLTPLQASLFTPALSTKLIWSLLYIYLLLILSMHVQIRAKANLKVRIPLVLYMPEHLSVFFYVSLTVHFTIRCLRTNKLQFIFTLICLN
jgi:hypothetical protein